MQRRWALLMAATLLTMGCSGQPKRPAVPVSDKVARCSVPAQQPADHEVMVDVYFSCQTETSPPQPHPVARVLPEGESGLKAALRALLKGPTETERKAGFDSWFSAATADALRSVTVEGGIAVIDFADLTGLIPNASSSAGSAMLLGELGATIAQFPEIRQVEFRMEGSCDRFWNWLQMDCHTETLDQYRT